MPLTPHPRLYLDPRRLTPDVSGDPVLRRVAEQVGAAADRYAGDTGYDELPATHNAHLTRARRMQTRVLTLVVQWLRTREERYRDAAVAHLQTIGRWEYWSWITWRRGDARPEAIFDLSYGENSATLALAYDLLFDDLDATARESIVEIARRRSLRPFLHVLEHERPSWFGRPDSNWNTVCAGGAGMLALATHEDLPEAAPVLAAAEESVAPFMATLADTDGGWPEGIGYWNYGMRYAFMYLLSHERALGAPHPLLEADATGRTLAFPLDFCPYGQPCSFGDSNHWSPLPFHYAAAERLGREDVRTAVGEELRSRLTGEDGQSWPDQAEALVLLPPADAAGTGAGPAGGSGTGPAAGAEPRVRRYDGLGWVRLADRWPRPRLYLAVRGGTTEVPHGHLDLLSFYLAVGDERLVENLTPAEYLDTTFGPRRTELFEMVPASKNVPLIDGVGIAPPARVDPQLRDCAGYPAVLLDATEAMGGARDDEGLAASCRRLFVLFDDRAVLVLDRIELRHQGRVESRLHTRAGVRAEGAQAWLTGERQRLRAHFAGDAGFRLTVTPTVPTTPGDDATLLRWQGPTELGTSFVMAALLVPGDVESGLAVERAGDAVGVRVRAGGWSTELQL